MQRVLTLKDSDKVFGAYAHNIFDKKIGLIGRSACITVCETNQPTNAEIIKLADDLAMHCLGLKPDYL